MLHNMRPKTILTPECSQNRTNASLHAFTLFSFLKPWSQSLHWLVAALAQHQASASWGH
jgi:hypothetical protein